MPATLSQQPSYSATLGAPQAFNASIGTYAVLSVFGRVGAVVAQAGDYSASQVANAVDSSQVYSNPSWIGSLDYSKITGVPSSVGAVSSVFGRTGAITANAGDYTAAKVTNAVDATRTYADPAWLTALSWPKITGVPLLVNTFNGRAGGVVPATGDYTAAQVTNAVDSTQTYADPAWLTALSWSKLTGAPVLVNSFNGRSGAVVPATGDYTAAQVTNAVSTAGSYSDPAWLTALNWSKLTGSPSSAQIGGIQTPWLQNIAAAGFQLLNVGKVSIGTTSPQGLLDIESSGSAIFLFQGNNYPIFRMGNTALADPLGRWGVYIGSDGSYRVYEYTTINYGSGSDRLTIKSGGNVGIGTNIPAAKLHVEESKTSTAYDGTPAASPCIINSSNAVNAPYGLQLGGFAGFIHSGIYGVMTSTSGNTQGDIAFAMRPTPGSATLTERMRITSGGNVGIGTASPQGKLHVAGGNSILAAQASQAIADGSMDNGSIQFYLDEAGGNLKCRVKYSNGTLKTATVALV